MQPGSSGQRSTPPPLLPGVQARGSEQDLVVRVDLPALVQRLQRSHRGAPAAAPAEPSGTAGCSFRAASVQASLWVKARVLLPS